MVPGALVEGQLDDSWSSDAAIVICNWEGASGVLNLVTERKTPCYLRSSDLSGS